MKIETVDKNFAVVRQISGGIKYYNIPHPDFDLYGIKYDQQKGFFRMPIMIAERVSEGVGLLASNTSGGAYSIFYGFEET